MNLNLIAQASTAVALAGAAIYVASRGGRTQVHGLVMTLIASLLAWSGGYAVFMASGHGTAAQVAMMTLFLGVVVLPPVWVVLAAHHTRFHLFDERPGWLIALLVPPAMTALAVVTNPGHRLFVLDFDPELLAQPPHVWAGPLFWLGIGWGVMLTVIGGVLYLGTALRLWREGERRRGVAIAVAVLMPFALSPITGLYLGIDLTSTFVALSAAMLFWSSWRHRVLETLPLARRDVIEHLVEGVILADVSARVLDVNPAAEKLLGRGAAQVGGESLARLLGDLASDEHQLGVVGALEQLVETGQPVQLEFDSSDGRCLEVTAAAVRAADGERASFYALLRNRTDQRRLDEILMQSQRLQTTASLSVGITHEIKNPLAFVKSNLSHIQRVAEQLALEWGEEDPNTEHMRDLAAAADESLSGVDRISGTIERMRRFSRLSSGEMTGVDVGRVVDDAIKMARLRGGPELRVQVHHASTLPEVRGSAEHLVQVLLNLIDNARQALADRADARIALSTRRMGQHVEIQVSDNGPGIPESIQERIFDAFYTTKQSGEGSGIGLAISFAIVREHGGDLDFESRPGEGTEFTIRLPLPVPSPPSQPARSDPDA